MRYLKVLYVQVLIGICLGILTGWLFPSFAPAGKLISEIFIDMIKMVIAPIIFFSIVLGIVGGGDLKKVGRVGAKGLLYFEIVTTITIIIGLVVANILQPGAGIPAEQISTVEPVALPGEKSGMDWGSFLRNIVPSNIVNAFAKGDIIQILFFGILFSVALMKMGETGKSITSMFERFKTVMFKILHMVIKVSPLGAFGGMCYTIGEYGFGSLALLGKLMFSFYLTGFLFIFVILNIIARIYGFSLWKLLKYIKDELFIVFGASSSEAVLPNIMEKLERAGCEKSVVGLIIPSGYSFNLDGTCIYLSMSIIFLAQVFHVPLTLWEQISVILVLLVSSKGAAGVTGSGFLVLTSTLAAIKIIPMEGLALLIGVDRFLSEGRAITNIIGNTVATVVIAKSEKAVDESVYKQVVEAA
ncbi:MAG: C4-dicarboxylate transporter DctA [Chitinophagaceae bacterium]|nr:C4-dicarboxylate transporter DctA [Chitinophagaceae bacterium]